MDTYNPQTIGRSDLDSILARVDRYVGRHGSAYGENPVPGGERQETAQAIVAEWQTADWTDLELKYLARNGRTLFGPDLSDMGRHVRAVLFIAGRFRRRRWTYAAADRRAGRAESRRRDMDDSRGVGMSSRSADPALIAQAIESSGGVIRSTPDRVRRRRLRWIKTRNSTGWTIDVVRRLADRTDIEIRRHVRFNFKRIGDIPNRACWKTANRHGWTPDQMREALTGGR